MRPTSFFDPGNDGFDGADYALFGTIAVVTVGRAMHVLTAFFDIADDGVPGRITFAYRAA